MDTEGVVGSMAKAASHCPECGVFVKRENLPSHLRKAHGLSAEAARVERESPRARRGRRSSAFPLSAVLVFVLIAGLVGTGAFLASRPPPPLTEMCVQHSGLGVHWHAHLEIPVLGSPYSIPANIGIVSNTCYRPLHTHENDPGTIHIELPGPRTVYLGDFFAIWGQSFSRDRILSYSADASHEIVMSVGGVASEAYENLSLLSGQNILIEYRAL